MRLNLLPIVGLGLLAKSVFAQGAVAEPGSLLVFHEFDNRLGIANLITVTNTAAGASDSVDVHYVYRGRWGQSETLLPCLETNRTRTLTPNDTISVLTYNDNPNQVAGYLYAYATSHTSGQPIKFDHLIGNNLVIDGLGAFDYSVNPFVFKAGGGLAERANTDLDSDGIRDLNGSEYSQSPDEILVPRFLGQGGRAMNVGYGSDLVLINLTGGTRFDAIIDFLIYNDNEEEFSAQYQFNCWEKAPLLSISGVFANQFLLTSTNHNPNEIPGANYVKTGWFRIDGNVAFSQAAQFADPAILAVLVEKIGAYKAADLPFGQGVQANGDLLPQSLVGDNN